MVLVRVGWRSVEWWCGCFCLRRVGCVWCWVGWVVFEWWFFVVIVLVWCVLCGCCLLLLLLYVVFLMLWVFCCFRIEFVDCFFYCWVWCGVGFWRRCFVFVGWFLFGMCLSCCWGVGVGGVFVWVVVWDVLFMFLSCDSCVIVEFVSVFLWVVIRCFNGCVFSWWLSRCLFWW